MPRQRGRRRPLSAPLHDVRAAVEDHVHTMLEAYASARDTTMADVIRGVLRQWAENELELHRKVHTNLKRAGLDDRGEVVRKP